MRWCITRVNAAAPSCARQRTCDRTLMNPASYPRSESHISDLSVHLPDDLPSLITSLPICEGPASSGHQHPQSPRAGLDPPSPAMSPLPPKLVATLRLLCRPSQWKWLERYINKTYFAPCVFLLFASQLQYLTSLKYPRLRRLHRI